MQYFYRCGCDTWSMTLKVDSRLGLGTVLVLISTGTVMAVYSRIWEKTAYCIASLTVPVTKYCQNCERKKGDWFVTLFEA